MFTAIVAIIFGGAAVMFLIALLISKSLTEAQKVARGYVITAIKNILLIVAGLALLYLILTWLATRCG